VIRSPAAVIFDVEGTLIDCVPLVLESWRETLHKAGHLFSVQDLQPYSGMDGAWMLERLLPLEPVDVRQQLLEEQGRRYRTDFLRLARPFAGVRELVEGLKAWGVAVGLATTCKGDELAAYDERVQVRPLADAIVCGEAVKHGKPHPALLRDCLTALGVDDSSAVIAVGDTPYDAIAAKGAGMRCVGVLTGGFTRQSLQAAGCDEVLDRVVTLTCLWRGEAAQLRMGMSAGAHRRPRRGRAAAKS
jgi:HAD superfamily hydrolase (TIGR01509 family)